VGGEDDRRVGGVLNMATPHRRYGNLTSSSQQRAASPRYVAYNNGDSLTGLQDVSEGQVGEVLFVRENKLLFLEAILSF
jgi:hypothetical protein